MWQLPQGPRAQQDLQERIDFLKDHTTNPEEIPAIPTANIKLHNDAQLVYSKSLLAAGCNKKKLETIQEKQVTLKAKQRKKRKIKKRLLGVMRYARRKKHLPDPKSG